MNGKLLLLTGILVCGVSIYSTAQITLLDSFNPSDAGSLCGIGYHGDSAHIWIYGCNDDVIQCYSPAENFIKELSAPGGAANDVDLEIAPEEILFDESIIPQGQLLFINGEDGAAEIYAIDNSTGNVIDTLPAQFGTGHIVGGAYHPERNTFFLVQDNVPGVAMENLIAEIDPTTGDTLNVFQITEYFSVSYGDLEVGSNGNLFVVSSVETSIAEFSPDGNFIQSHELPPGVATLSGIALDCSAGEAWVSSTGGSVFRLGQFPCSSATGIMENTMQSFTIGDIIPNPVHSVFSFSVETKESVQLKLTLFDMMGKEVKLIHDGITETGKMEFSVFGSPMQNGVYILMAESNTCSVTKRIICIK
jgi:hypothetical protein